MKQRFMMWSGLFDKNYFMFLNIKGLISKGQPYFSTKSTPVYLFQSLQIAAYKMHLFIISYTVSK